MITRKRFLIEEEKFVREETDVEAPVKRLVCIKKELKKIKGGSPIQNFLQFISSGT